MPFIRRDPAISTRVNLDSVTQLIMYTPNETRDNKNYKLYLLNPLTSTLCYLSGNYTVHDSATLQVRSSRWNLYLKIGWYTDHDSDTIKVRTSRPKFTLGHKLITRNTIALNAKASSETQNKTGGSKSSLGKRPTKTSVMTGIDPQTGMVDEPLSKTLPLRQHYYTLYITGITNNNPLTNLKAKPSKRYRAVTPSYGYWHSPIT